MTPFLTILPAAARRFYSGPRYHRRQTKDEVARMERFATELMNAQASNLAGLQDQASRCHHPFLQNTQMSGSSLWNLLP